MLDCVGRSLAIGPGDAIDSLGQNQNSADFSMRKRRGVLILLTVAASLAVSGLAGCTHDRYGDPRKHYAQFEVAPPDGDAVEVCHAYTCRMKTTLLFPSEGHPGDRRADAQDEEGRYPLRGAPRHRLRHRLHRAHRRRAPRHQGPGGHGVRRIGRSDPGRLRRRGDQHHELHARAAKSRTPQISHGPDSLLQGRLAQEPPSKAIR